MIKLKLSKQKINNVFIAIKNISLFVALFLFLMFCQNNNSFSYERIVSKPVAGDTRIKTLLYSPREIFSVKFGVNHQSILELEQNEEIEIMAFGDPVPWNFNVIGHRIFIKAIDPGVKTNLTIKTNKRLYLLDIESSHIDDEEVDDQITYLINFFYPELDSDDVKKYSVRNAGLEKPIPMAGKSDEIEGEAINYLYTYAGTSSKILPKRIFDDGKKTYFKFGMHNMDVPAIYAVDKEGRERRLPVNIEGNYITIDSIQEQITLRSEKELICIFNESMVRTRLNPQLDVEERYIENNRKK